MINTKGLPMRRQGLRWDWEGAQIMVMVIKPHSQNTHVKQILKKCHFLQHHFVMRKKLIPGRFCFLWVLWFLPTLQDVHVRWNGMSKLYQCECVGVCSAPYDGRMSCPTSCSWAAETDSGHPQLLVGISGLEKKDLISIHLLKCFTHISMFNISVWVFI